MTSIFFYRDLNCFQMLYSRWWFLFKKFLEPCKWMQSFNQIDKIYKLNDFHTLYPQSGPKYQGQHCKWCIRLFHTGYRTRIWFEKSKKNQLAGLGNLSSVAVGIGYPIQWICWMIIRAESWIYCRAGVLLFRCLIHRYQGIQWNPESKKMNNHQFAHSFSDYAMKPTGSLIRCSKYKCIA